MDLVETKEKVQKFFSWEKIAENLPLIGGVALGIIVLDKLLSVGKHLEPVYNLVRQWNSDDLFETIDSVGDNIQLVDSIFKAFKIEMGGDNLDKLADFLQSLATGGKHLSKLMGVIGLNKLLGKGGSGRGSRSGYKEL